MTYLRLGTEFLKISSGTQEYGKIFNENLQRFTDSARQGMIPNNY